MARPVGLAAPEPQMGDGVDAPHLMSALWKHKGAIILPTALAAAAALALVIAVPSRYTSVAKILLENQESLVTTPDKGGNGASAPLDEVAVLSAAESLATPDIAHKAIDKLDLGRLPEFHPSQLQRIVNSLVAGARGGAYDDVTVETFLGRLNVFPVAHSRVLQIEFSSQDPTLAASVANTVAQLFLVSQGGARQLEAKSAADWLSTHIEPLRAKMVQTETEIQARRVQAGLLPTANGQTAPTQRLTELTTQVATARAALAAANAKASSLRDYLSSGRADVIPDVARDESMRRYLDARVALKTQISEASRTLLGEHPRMRELEGQLEGLDEQIRAAASKTVLAYETDAHVAAEQVKNLEQQIKEQSRAVAATDTDSVKLSALEIEAKTEREQLESYLGKYRDAVARESVDAVPPNARVIETASAAASPSFPKRGPTIVLAALAGFVLSLGVAVARALTAAPEPAKPLLADEAYARAVATAFGPHSGNSQPQGWASPRTAALSRVAPPPAAQRQAIRQATRASNPGAHVVPPPVRSAPIEPIPEYAEAAALALRQAHEAMAAQLPAEAELPDDADWPEPEPQPVERIRPLLPGASPVQLTGRDPVGGFITQESEASLTGSVDEFLHHAPQGPLMIVVCGEGARGALSAALGAARRFAKRGPTVLVDLGATQPWLADVVQPGRYGFLGLSEVASGRVNMEYGLHHDLSSRLDVMPTGADSATAEGLEWVLDRLGERYPFVIAHASDWRSPLGRQALSYCDGALVCGSSPRIAQIRAGVARAVGARPFLLVDLVLEKSEVNERAA